MAEEIGEKIRSAREVKGLSQKALADRIGLKQPSLSDIEAGKSKPRDATLFALAAELQSDFGLPSLRDRLIADAKTNLDFYLRRILSILKNDEYGIYLVVARMAMASDTFRDMLKPDSYEEARQKAYIVSQFVNERTGKFDLEAAVKKYDNALPVLRDWFAHDQVTVHIPQTMAFDGWANMTFEEKVAQVKRVRDMLVEDVDFEKARIAHETSSHVKHPKKI